MEGSGGFTSSLFAKRENIGVGDRVQLDVFYRAVPRVKKGSDRRYPSEIDLLSRLTDSRYEPFGGLYHE